jgi:hypothetical protein
MGQRETGDAFFTALNGQRWDEVGNLLTDDFQWIVSANLANNSANKQQYIASQQALFAGMPDYRVTWEPSGEDGNTLSGTMRIAGTHTNPLAALAGQAPLPPTGKRVSVAAETALTLRGDKVASMTSRPTTPTIGEQLGMIPPA